MPENGQPKVPPKSPGFSRWRRAYIEDVKILHLVIQPRLLDGSIVKSLWRCTELVHCPMMCSDVLRVVLVAIYCTLCVCVCAILL